MAPACGKFVSVRQCPLMPLQRQISSQSRLHELPYLRSSYQQLVCVHRRTLNSSGADHGRGSHNSQKSFSDYNLAAQWRSQASTRVPVARSQSRSSFLPPPVNFARSPPAAKLVRSYFSTTTSCYSNSSESTTPVLNQAPAAAAADRPTPQEQYFVYRTKSNNLPVYLDAKRGGNLRMTQIRKLDGELSVLRDQLREALGLGEEVAINQMTKHINIKGWYREEVLKFLRDKHF